jgi:hypothetical protein
MSKRSSERPELESTVPASSRYPIEPPSPGESVSPPATRGPAGANEEALSTLVTSAGSTAAGLFSRANALRGAHTRAAIKKHGYTLSQSIYIGAVFDYWFGESEEQTVPGFPGGPGGGTVSASVSGWDLMGEVGYDFGVSPTVVIRPLGGIGVFHADGETCAPVIGCMEISESEAAGAFGGQLLVDLDGFNVGAEFRVLFADETAVLVGGNVGAAF